MLHSRDQELAKTVYEQVSAFKQLHTNAEGKTDKKVKQYGSMAHKLPLMIRSAGLAQSLAFVQVKGKKPAYKQLLDDLAQTLDQSSGEEFVNQSRIVSLDEYMFLTQNALAALLWYKRYAQSVLDVEPGDEPDEADDEIISDDQQQDGIK